MIKKPIQTASETRRFQWRVALVAAAALVVGGLVVGSASALEPSPMNSLAIMNLGTETAATSDAMIIRPHNADVTAGSQAATVVVSLKDAAGNALTADTLTVSIEGVGLLGTGTGSPTQFLPTGHSISVGVSSSVTGKYLFGIFSDGNGGFATVSIHDGATLIGTKIASFAGPVATLTVVQKLYIANTSGSPLGSDSPHNAGFGSNGGTPAIILTAKDANGMPIPNEDPDEFSALSSDLAVMSSQIDMFPDDGLGAGSLGRGTYNVQVRSASGVASGKSATLTFRYSSDGVNYVLSPPVTFTTGSSTIAKVMMSFDSEAYAPGKNATLTIRATDSSGNPVSGQDSGNFFASSTGLWTTVDVHKLLFPFTTLTLIEGQATTSFDMPATSGAFTVSGRLGNGANLASAIQGQTISASATIFSSQDLDISATRATAMASLQAVISLTALVRSLVATIASLVKTVAQIKKKLGIK
jgi:hypothetical protein